MTCEDDWDDNDLDQIEALMSEDTVGENHGSSAGALIYRDRIDGEPGETAPAPRRSLSTATRDARQFASQGYATVVHREELNWYGARGYEPGEYARTLSSEEWSGLDADALRAQVLDMLGGFTQTDLDRLNTTGRDGPEVRVLRVRFEDAVLALMESNGYTGQVGKTGHGSSLLARSLGFPVTAGTSDSPRLRNMLRKARRRREAAAA